MKTTPNRFSLSHRRRTANSLWPGVGLRAVRAHRAAASRHAKWTQSILSRFQPNRRMRRRYPQAMIPVFAARAANHFFQTLQVKNYGGGYTAPMAPQAMILGGINQQNTFHTQSGVEIIRELRPILSPNVQRASSRPFAGTPRNATHPFATTPVRELRLAAWQHFAAESDSAPAQRKFARFLRQRPQQAIDESTSASHKLLSNIGRKHRRIEVTPPASMRARRAVFASPRDSEDIVAARSASTARGARFDEPDPHQRTPRASEIPFDAARMTDEVLKQLDRRLVAAKERRGRI
jgi:hypothetical protein